MPKGEVADVRGERGESHEVKKIQRYLLLLLPPTISDTIIPFYLYMYISIHLVLIYSSFNDKCYARSVFCGTSMYQQCKMYRIDSYNMGVGVGVGLFIRSFLTSCEAWEGGPYTSALFPSFLQQSHHPVCAYIPKLSSDARVCRFHSVSKFVLRTPSLLIMLLQAFFSASFGS